MKKPSKRDLFINSLGQRAKIYRLIGQNHKALKDLERAKKYADGNKDKRTIAGLIVDIGNIYGSLCKFKKMERSLNEGLRIYQSINDKSGISICLTNIAYIFILKRDFIKAKESTEGTLVLCEELKDQNSIATYYNNMGYIYMNLGDVRMGFASYERSLKISKRINDIENLSKSLNNLGAAYFRTGEYDKGLEHFLKSIEIRKKIGDQMGEATCLNNIASYYMNKRDMENSLMYYNRSLEICKEIDFKRGEIFIYSNIARIYRMLMQYDKALEYFKKALKGFQSEFMDPMDQVNVMNDIAGIYFIKGMYKDSFYYYNGQLELRKKMGDIPGSCSVILNISEICIEQKEFRKAKSNLLKAEKIMGKHDDKNFSLRKSVVGVEYGILVENNDSSYERIELNRLIYEADALAKELKSLYWSAKVLIIRARFESLKRPHDEKIIKDTFRQAIEFYKKHDYMYELARAHFYFAQYLLTLKEMRSADENLRRARSIFKKIGNSEYIKRSDRLCRKIS